MIKLTVQIVCLGKLKEKYLSDGIDEYAKRLGRFCSFEIIQLGDAKIPENASEAQCEQILAQEGKAVLKKLSDDAFKIALCIEGKRFSSEEFAKLLRDTTLRGKSRIAFVIGGSLGLSEEVKRQCDLLMSFSPLTFPHQLMRLILSEQIYRAFKINANEQYHK